MVSEKIGKKLTAALTYLILFILVGAYTYLQMEGYVNSEVVQKFFTVFSASIATYEIIIKRWIKPLFEPM